MSETTPQPPSASSRVALGLGGPRSSAVVHRRGRALRLSSIAIRTATACRAAAGRSESRG